jgi:hypothetical protein
MYRVYHEQDDSTTEYGSAMDRKIAGACKRAPGIQVKTAKRLATLFRKDDCIARRIAAGAVMQSRRVRSCGRGAQLNVPNIISDDSWCSSRDMLFFIMTQATESLRRTLGFCILPYCFLRVTQSLMLYPYKTCTVSFHLQLCLSVILTVPVHILHLLRTMMDVPVPVAYELLSHHALGGGSYAFKIGYPAYLRASLPEPDRRTEVNVIIQPNSTPHIGTLCCLGLTFIIARRLLDKGLDVSVTCDL